MGARYQENHNKKMYQHKQTNYQTKEKFIIKKKLNKTDKQKSKIMTG